MGAVVIAVAGASGGLGVSTASAHLAWRADLARACLVDGDHASAIDVTVGIDHLEGPRWGSFARLQGEADGARVLAALPSTSRYAVLAGSDLAPPPAAARSVLEGLRTATDLLVVDLGRLSPGFEAVGVAIDHLVLLAGLGVRHLGDLERAVGLVRDQPSAVHLVTRGERRLCAIGESVAQHVGIPLLGHWSDDRTVPRDLERGVPPGERTHGFDALADRLLAGSTRIQAIVA